MFNCRDNILLSLQYVRYVSSLLDLVDNNDKDPWINKIISLEIMF